MTTVRYALQELQRAARAAIGKLDATLGAAEFDPLLTEADSEQQRLLAEAGLAVRDFERALTASHGSADRAEAEHEAKSGVLSCDEYVARSTYTREEALSVAWTWKHRALGAAEALGRRPGESWDLGARIREVMLAVPARTEAFLGLGTPWPTIDVLRQLVEAADRLLDGRDHDGDGWELIDAARTAARQRIAAWDTGAPSAPTVGGS